MDIKTLSVLSGDAFDKFFSEVLPIASLPGVILPTKAVEELIGQTVLLINYEVVEATQYGEMYIMNCVDKNRSAFQVSSSSKMIHRTLQLIEEDKLPVKISFNAGNGKQGPYYFIS